jgi:hypothetical protein
MFVAKPRPYEGFRGCFLTAANNSTISEYICLAVVEAGEYVEKTNVSCRYLYLRSGDDFDGDQRLQIMSVFVLVKLFVILSLLDS